MFVGFVFWFCIGRHLAFALTYSPTCGNSQSKTIRFDDRLSLERARHELKKKMPCRPGGDVHDFVLPTSYWQAWKTWEHSKKEIEAKATTAGVIWFVGEEAVEQRIWEIISRDEIAMNVTYEEAREHDNLKEGRATKRRRRDGPSSQAPMVSTKGT